MGYPSSGPSATGAGGFGSKGSRAGGLGITVELDGMTEFKARWKQAMAGVAMSGPLISHAVAKDIAETAKDFSPFDPDNGGEPHVRDNIHVRRAGKGAEVYVNRGGTRDEVPNYLEFGTYKMAARPFLVPAARQVIASRGVLSASRRVGGLMSPTGISVEG